MNQYYKGLTGLRGIGAMGVIAYHVYVICGFTGTSYMADRTIGNFGAFVQLFFVLSGFGLMSSCQEKYSGRIDCEDFYKRRFLKIVPTFWFALLITCILNMITGVRSEPGNIIATGSLLFYFFPPYRESVVAAAWSLGIEVVFYIFFPLLFLCSKKKKRCLICFLVTVLLYFCYDLIPKTEGSLAHINLVYQLPFFVLGMLLYHFRGLFESFGGKRRKVFYALTFLLDAICFLLYPNNRLICLVIAFSLLVFNQIGFKDRLINNPVFCFLGGLSYPMYLFHMIVFSVLYNLGVFRMTETLGSGWAYLIDYGLVLGLTVLCSFIYRKIYASLYPRILSCLRQTDIHKN